MKSTKKEKTERQVERSRKIRKTVKGLIFPVVVLALVAAGVYMIMNYTGQEEESEPIPIYAYEGDKTPLTLESDKLLFTMDPETTQFTVEQKDTGKIWRSNPEGAAGDPKAQSEEKDKLQSTLLMSYSITSGLETTYNSFGYSVKNGIYEIIPEEDSIRVNYSMGQVQKEYTIPPVTTEENFDKWTGLMEPKERDLFQQYYKKYDINKLSKKDNKEELTATYPIIEQQVIYVLREGTKDKVQAKMEEYMEAVGYTYDDFLADKELSTAEKTSDKPVFNVSMIYRLEGDDLVVEIPFKDLAYKKDSPIYTITPLPFFGAGGTEDEGFMLVPEGGGSIIRFNNGKVSQSSYYANVYGWDMAISRNAVVHNTRTYYGVYGVSSEEDSFICILEDGRSYASIQSDISGKNNSYNYVNAIYSICQREQYDVGDIANSDIYMYLQELPDESISQRYRFIEAPDYVTMAKDYGKYLQDRYGDALSLNTDESTPVAVEIIGAVDKTRQVLGVPVSKPLKMTTYEEARDMISDLKDENIANLSVKLTGWCNGGVKQKLLDSVHLISDLGGKSDLQSLSETSSRLGVNLYLDGITQYAINSDLTDGFFSYRDAAKNISKERVALLEYSQVTYGERDDLDEYYLLHTENAQDTTDTLVEAADEYGAGISFQDTGKDLSSDFYRKKPYSRQSVLKIHEDRLKELSEAGKKICVNMGNDYAVPYCSLVTNMDLRGSEYTILDECIPFFQLAVHGYVDYTGYPLNICGNTEDEVLYSAEYGAGLSFTLMQESTFALQKTLYTQYYGSTYADWKDNMLSIYERYNKELGHTFNQEMTGHVNLSPVLSRTDYEDGTRVYVNYGYSDAKEDGVTVPARDYLVVR